MNILTILWNALIVYWDRSSSEEDTPPVVPTLSEQPQVQTMQQTPIQTPTVVSSAKRLDTLCTAIQNFEGKPGDANYINCNPGNFRCSPVGYLPKYGNVKCSPAGFAVFPSMALGWEYLENSIHFTAISHPTWTFYEFIANRAPASDGNDPKHYAEVVAQDCGVPPTCTLAQYLCA